MNKLRWLVLVIAVAFIAFAGVWGTGVFGKLSGSSSLDDPASESVRINQRIIDELGPQGIDFIALYSSDIARVDDPEFRSAVTAVVDRLRHDPVVASVNSYYDAHTPALISADTHQTYVTIRLNPKASDDQAAVVRHDLAATGLRSQVGGQRAIDLDINNSVGTDIGRAEMIGMPILVLALLFVFGNVVAACMPVLIGGFAVLGAFALVRLITMFTEVSVFSISIITILGLGLAVDYGLFMVSRFRDELDEGYDVPVAVSRTVATAGRTVAVSGVLVALALSSLMIFPQVLLHSMGLGGAAAVLVAMVSSLTVLPALLALLGRRIDALAMPWSRRRRFPSVTGAVTAGVNSLSGGDWWGRVAAAVMRRPVRYLLGVVLLLGVLTLPFARTHFGGVDERMLPDGTQSRVVSDQLAANFPDGGIRPVSVLISDASPAAAASFQRQIGAISGVNDTVIAAQAGTTTLLRANYSGAASSASARAIVDDIRALDPPAGASVMVGGSSAKVTDQLNSLADRLPWMALLVAAITFIVLAVSFGSVVVPLKAILMNLLSIGAALGVVTWVFQDGHLAGLFGFTPTGYVEASQPVLMVAILFGLSMDYEVFLLSRIRERWDELGDNTAAVTSGVQRTGRLITTAALLLCVVLGAFATSGITFIKMIGVGMVVALLVDATLVRLLLVPATMRLLGKSNWWAPPFLRKLYGRYGVRESDALEFDMAELRADDLISPTTSGQ